MERPPTALADEARDARLAAVLGALLDGFNAGGPVDLEAAAAQHPDLADELRDLWAAASLAVELAPSLGGDETVTWHPGSDSEGADAPDVSSPRSGQHELLEELGRGGMGVVHRARQVPLNRIVAVKRLLKGASASAEDKARFRAEGEAAARLAHPHVVAVHDVGSSDGQPFLVMEYVEGTTLARRLAGGPLPPAEAAEILAPVCRAIQHAHERGVLHRDLKPSNILIGRDGRPMVGDFGLAKRIDLDLGADGADPLTATGAILGTPSYMAPEQAASGRGGIGPPTDVYALGAILYQMLTGRPPFQAASPLDTILLVLEQDPVPPRLLNPKADADLEMVALKCLQKHPEHRYPTAAALADDLDAYRSGQPVSARSTSFRALAGRYLGETPHAVLLENWGDLWMYHSVALIVFYGLTWWLLARGVAARWPYFAIFTVGLGAWAAFFWKLRSRRGPVTFVERQLAHIWGAGVVALNLLLVAEALMGLPVMALAPLLAVTNGTLFLIKAGILSGEFYVHAAALLAMVVPAALYPKAAIPIFALTSAASFFVTGLKYHRRHLRGRRSAR